MTHPPDKKDEPFHRQWLHAAEREMTVPSDPMQVFRVYADYGASRGGRAVPISYPELRRQTHMSYGRISAAITWGVEHGWLSLAPGKDGKEPANGQRKSYNLSIGGPGEKRKPPRRRGESEESGTPDHYDTRSGSEAANHYDTRSGSTGPDHYDTRSATTTTPVAEPLRHPKRKRLTSETSLSPRPGTRHALLAAVVPDVTERETELVIGLLEERPTVDSGYAVLPREIEAGNGPKLVAAVRASAVAGPASVGIPSAPPLQAICSRCSSTRHTVDDCPTLTEDAAPASQPRPLAATAPPGSHPGGEPCAYARCRQLGTPVAPGSDYHAPCEHLARTRTRAAELASVGDGDHAA